MRIAILDDNPDICDVFQSALKLAGHEVSVYQESTAFLNAVMQEHGPTQPVPCDLVIVDLCLPGPYSGAQVIHSLKMTHAELPAVLCSAVDGAKLEAALQGLPKVKVLRKPFKVTDLLGLLSSLTKFTTLHSSSASQAS